MTDNIYDVGDKITITGTFSLAGVNTDPAAVHASYKSPSGVIVALVYGVDAGLTKSATGVYAFSIVTTESGVYHYRMDDNGVNVATEGYFKVKVSQV